ncbi:acyltransferase family protein [Demequina lutea]|uniref:Peptidoglycan/LPS O-acetylase OafA/YrhL n=1 Tax=Demequina lutea TaxID=431489 RepID=A0A7Z0CGZ5_9MICO|nr:acyltransferase [Demequina lutea]NYI40274.1 peptidoglycan/LPS O-acetylase OafA/YrhL [Demequina lutea]
MGNEADQRHSDRILGADGIRAMAALGVIFSHLYQRLFMPDQAQWYQTVQALFMKGAFGVSTFFVLSGMLLSYPYWKAYLAGQPMPKLGHFVRRRAARIVPAYYASLLVSFALTFAIAPDAGYKVWRLIAGLTFTSDFDYVTFFPSEINGPLWSISFEVFSYVLLALMMAALFWWIGRRVAGSGAKVAAARRKGTPLRGLAYWAVIFVAVNVLNGVLVASVKLSDEGKGWQYGDIGGAKEWMPGYNPLGLFGHFLLGILAAWAIASWSARQAGAGGKAGDTAVALTRWWWDAIAAAGFVASGVLLWTVRSPAEPTNLTGFQDQPYLFPLFALAVAITLVGLAHSRLLGRIVDNRFARYTATVSFGLYVWHYLVLYLFSYITDGRFEYYGIHSWPQHLAISGAVLVVSYVIATFSWRWLEQPVLRSRWATRR